MRPTDPMISRFISCCGCVCGHIPNPYPLKKVRRPLAAGAPGGFGGREPPSGVWGGAPFRRRSNSTGNVCGSGILDFILLQTVSGVYATHRPYDFSLYKLLRVCMRRIESRVYSFTSGTGNLKKRSCVTHLVSQLHRHNFSD